MRNRNRSRSGDPSPNSDEVTSWRLRRIDGLLRRAEQDPSVVLRDRRCRKPAFCEGFLKICDDQCLKQPKAALDYCHSAVELAGQIGDRHLMHRSRGVLVHAHIANQQWDEAGELLDDYRVAAFACCKACGSDWLRRQADLRIETRDPKAAHRAVERGMRQLGDDLDDDMRGRFRFLRRIAYYQEEDPERAVEDAGQALRELALDTPKGYFLDTLAFIAVFLQFDDVRNHYQMALDELVRFRRRLKGLEGWSEVRLRQAWVEAVVRARLGDLQAAAQRLERVFEANLESGSARHALAAMVDRAQLFARRANELDRNNIRRVIDKITQRFDLDKKVKLWLENIIQVSSQRPGKTFQALARFRFSFIVPVPGLLVTGRRLR